MTHFEKWEEIKVWGLWDTVWCKWYFPADNWAIGREAAEQMANEYHFRYELRELPDSMIVTRPEAAAALVAAYDIFRARTAAKREQEGQK